MKNEQVKNNFSIDDVSEFHMFLGEQLLGRFNERYEGILGFSSSEIGIERSFSNLILTWIISLPVSKDEVPYIDWMIELIDVRDFQKPKNIELLDHNIYGVEFHKKWFYFTIESFGKDEASDQDFLDVLFAKTKHVKNQSKGQPRN